MADQVERIWNGARLRWVALVIFGAGFGFVEAAVVSYLRRIIGYQSGYHMGARKAYVDLGFITFVQPDRSVLVDPGLTQVETAREAATPVMLMAIAVMVVERPRRSSCSGCGRTHVLIGASMLARRADGAVVIGAALVAKAAGAGHRPIAAALGWPVSTVRGWLRRFTARAQAWRVSFTGLLHALDPRAGPIAVNASEFADAVEVLGLAAAAADRCSGRARRGSSPRRPPAGCYPARSRSPRRREGDQHELTLGTPPAPGQSPLVDHVRGHLRQMETGDDTPGPGRRPSK